MNSNKELDLLVDIIKLYKKYGQDSFSSLVRFLSEGNIEDISTLLKEIPSKTKNKEKDLKQRSSINILLSDLENADQEKFKIINEFYEELIAKIVLPTFRELKDFALDCDLELKTDSRQKAISPFIKHLIGLPKDQLISKIRSLNKRDADDRSLEGWSKIILNNELKDKE